MQETKKINESAREKRVDELDKKIADFIEKQKKLIKEIQMKMQAVKNQLRNNPKKMTKEDMAAQPPPGFHGGFRMPSLNDEGLKKADRVQKMLREMPRMLENDFNQAEKLADDILQQTKEFSERFDDEDFKERMKKKDSLESVKENTGEAQEKEEQLLEAFKEFKSGSDEFLSEGAKAKLKAMAEKQGELQGELGEFQKGLQGKAKKNPLLADKQMGEALDGAGKGMGESKEAMQSGKGSSSQQAQGEALSGLGAAKGRLQQLKEMMEGMQAQGSPGMPGSGMQMGGMPQGNKPDKGRQRSNRGRGVNVDDVNIPSAEDYKVPKEFREDILRGMKEKYPKDYEDKVKKYYEELIR